MQHFLTKASRGALAGGALIALLVGGTTAANAADNISGDIGVSYNSHFVSFGADVWGGKGDFFGDRSTTFIYGDFALKATDDFSFTLSVWTDNNDNAHSGIGGHLQEVDIDPGISYSFGKFTAGAVYNIWNYAGDAEESLDLSLGYDDTDLIAPGFALMPKILWHYRTAGDGGQTIGSAVVLSVGPSFPISDAFSITIPAGVAFFTTDDFQGGTESGYGYSYIGASFGYALNFIPSAYGAWSANFDLIGYFTDSKAIPGNPEHDFLTGSIGLKVAF